MEASFENGMRVGSHSEQLSELKRQRNKVTGTFIGAWALGMGAISVGAIVGFNEIWYSLAAIGLGILLNKFRNDQAKELDQKIARLERQIEVKIENGVQITQYFGS